MFQRTISSLMFAAATLGATAAFAQTAPDALIKQVAGEVIESVKSDKAIQAGDVSRIHGLVDAQVMPHVDFQRMTAATVGDKAYWHGNLGQRFHAAAGRLGISSEAASRLREAQRDQAACDSPAAGICAQSQDARHRVEPSQAELILEVL